MDPRTRYDEQYTQESLRNDRLMRENEALRNRQIYRDNTDASSGFLLGVLIAAIAALGFGAFYFFGRTETQEAAPQQNTVPEINVDVPSPPPVQAPNVEAPDVNIQLPEVPAGDAGSTGGASEGAGAGEGLQIPGTGGAGSTDAGSTEGSTQ
jgi:hypothetical protein